MAANEVLQTQPTCFVDCQQRVDCNNSPLPKVVIHYLRNRLGVVAVLRLESVADNQSEKVAVFNRDE